MTSTLNGHVQRTAATEVAERLGAAGGVKYAAISFVDMHGKPKAKMVPLNHLGQAARGSEMFTGGAALDGVPQDVNDDEVAPHPDLGGGRSSHPSTRRWRGSPGDLWIGDVPFEACSRQILKRVTADAATLATRSTSASRPSSSCSPTTGSGRRRRPASTTRSTSPATTFGVCCTTIRSSTRSSRR